MEIPKKLNDEIWEYCRLNNITDVDGFIVKMVKQGFTVEKFGATPHDNVVEKEVEKIVEVIKEVEKVVEVEVIKEVEKIVEKEVYITDEEANIELTKKIGELELEIKEVRGNLDEDEIGHNKHLRTEGNLNMKVVELNTKIKNLEEELAIEKAKPKQATKKDIYGEGRKGTYGSNTREV